MIKPYFVLCSFIFFFCDLQAQDDVHIQSISTQEFQYDYHRRIKVEFVNVSGNIIFYSDAKKFPTPYESYTPSFCGFTQHIIYKKHSDSSGYMQLSNVPAGCKVYYVDFRNDSLYLDSILPDSNQQISLYMAAEKCKNKTFQLESLKPEHWATYIIKLYSEGEDGTATTAHNVAIWSADKAKNYRQFNNQEHSQSFLFFYGKSFRIADKKTYDKAARKFR